MKYYISISAWNLLESFTTESISPVAFYAERAYGAKLSRFLEDKFDRTYKLILSTKDNGGDYTIEVDEELIDKSLLAPEKDKTIFSYPKTIYYQKGLVAFRFNTQEIMDSMIAESQILFEVKCVKKYQSDFYVKEVKPTTIKSGKIGNSLSFDFMNYVEQDNRYNLIKGAITGYARGIMTAQSSDSRTLQTKVMDLKNAFAGLNTITLMGSGEIMNAGKYIAMIEDCKILYNSQREEPTRIFDIMKQQFSEIIKLAETRANAISGHGLSYDQDMINSEIMSVRNRIFAIEEANNIGSLISELEAIKKSERENGLMVGVSATEFAPDETLTRAMLVTILYRLAGEPALTAKDTTFTDVPEDEWYANAVAWAVATGLTSGVSATEFAPDEPVSREQLVTFLWRYADKPDSTQSLSAFSDAGKVSDYAVTAMQWAVEQGIVKGSDGKLLPKTSATRAEIANIFMRFEKNA